VCAQIYIIWVCAYVGLSDIINIMIVHSILTATTKAFFDSLKFDESFLFVSVLYLLLLSW
jgi:hypothetical protein